MASSELHRLWKLHLIDAALLELRGRAARLDVGQAEHAKLKGLLEVDATTGAEARKLLAQETDAELADASLAAKLGKFEAQLFGGGVTNPREVEGIQKEVDSLKRQRAALDDQRLELMETAPPARAQAEAIKRDVAETRAAFEAKQAAAAAKKSELEAGYKDLSAQRPAAAAAVPPALLVRYEANRKRHDGVGIAEVVRKSFCGACGMNLPERTIADARDGKVVSCEACHRILYVPMGTA